MPENVRKPLLSGVMRWFLFTMVLANTGIFMQQPLLPLYLQELGASVTQVGLVFTLSSIVPLLLQIVGGWVSDMLGRLRAIALGSVGGVLSYIVFVMAPSWQWIILAQTFGVAAGALVAPSFGAFIAEQSSERDRGKAYGVAEALFWIVAVIGPPLGGFVAARFGFRRMFLLGGCLYGVATIIRIWMAGSFRETSEAHPQQLTWDSLRGGLGAMVSMVLAGGLVTWIMITDGVRDVAFRLSGELMPLYLREVGGVSVENIGYLGAVFGIGMVMTALPAGWLSDKFGERIVIVGGFVMESVAFILLVSVRSLTGFGLVWLIFGVGVGLMRPAYQSLVSKAVPEKLRGTAFGLFQSSIGAISLPAPWLGAQMWERFNPRTPFVLTACMALATVVPVWVKFRLPRTEVEEQPPVIGREPC